MFIELAQNLYYIHGQHTEESLVYRKNRAVDLGIKPGSNYTEISLIARSYLGLELLATDPIKVPGGGDRLLRVFAGLKQVNNFGADQGLDLGLPLVLGYAEVCDLNPKGDPIPRAIAFMESDFRRDDYDWEFYIDRFKAVSNEVLGFQDQFIEPIPNPSGCFKWILAGAGAFWGGLAGAISVADSGFLTATFLGAVGAATGGTGGYVTGEYYFNRLPKWRELPVGLDETFGNVRAGEMIKSIASHIETTKFLEELNRLLQYRGEVSLNPGEIASAWRDLEMKKLAREYNGRRKDRAQTLSDMADYLVIF